MHQRVVAFETPAADVERGPLHGGTAAGKMIVVVTNEASGNFNSSYSVTVRTTDGQPRSWRGYSFRGDAAGKFFNVSLGLSAAPVVSFHVRSQAAPFATCDVWVDSDRLLAETDHAAAEHRALVLRGLAAAREGLGVVPLQPTPFPTASPPTPPGFGLFIQVSLGAPLDPFTLLRGRCMTVPYGVDPITDFHREKMYE